MPSRPLLVARMPRRVLPASLIHDRFSVGVLRLRGPSPPDVARHEDLVDFDHWLVVSVVATLPVVPEAGNPEGFGPAPRVVPSDLVPWRMHTDVIVRGSVEAGAVTLRVGDVVRRFGTAAPVGRVDLASGLVTPEGVPVVAKVLAPPESAAGTRWLDVADPETYEAVPSSLRFPLLRGDETIDVLTSGDSARISLPGVTPRLRVIAAMLGVPDQELRASLEEVLVDLDGRVARLVYRALVPTSRADARDVDRIDVLFEEPAPSGADEGRFVDHDVPRAAFEHAWEIAHTEAGEPPPALEEHELEIARYESWDHAGPLATMELGAAAAVAAELAEQREPRDTVLARHELTRYEWELEERAWAEALGAPPGPEEGPTLAELWSHSYREAQARLERPEEERLTVEDYARVTVALEGTEPDRAFSAHGIGLGAYQRLDRRMQERAAVDPAHAADVERALEAERAAARGRSGEARFAGLDLDDEGDA